MFAPPRFPHCQDWEWIDEIEERRKRNDNASMFGFMVIQFEVWYILLNVIQLINKIAKAPELAGA